MKHGQLFLARVLVFFCLALGLSACHAWHGCDSGWLSEARAGETGKDRPFRVVATTFPVWLFCRNVCENAHDVSLELLVPAQAGCPHDFSPGPGDMRKLEGADALVINGMGLEDFLPALEAGSVRFPRIVDASGGMPEVSETGMDNPHIFASPARAAQMSLNIAAGLGALDPANAALYEKNAAAFAKRLTAISDRLGAIGRTAQNRGIVLEHDALEWLAQNAGLNILETAQNHESASSLKRLRKLISEQKPALLAGDTQYNDSVLELLSRETGVPAARLDPVANGPADCPPDYYETMMLRNCVILEKYFD